MGPVAKLYESTFVIAWLAAAAACSGGDSKPAGDGTTGQSGSSGVVATSAATTAGTDTTASSSIGGSTTTATNTSATSTLGATTSVGGSGGATGTVSSNGATTSSGGASVGGATSTTSEGGSGGMVSSDPDERKLLLRDEGLSALHYVDLADSASNWSVTVPTGRDLQVVGDRRVMIGTDNGYEERSLDDGAFVSEMNAYPGTLTAHRLHSGNTLLAGVDFAGGQGIVLVEVDASGTEVDRVEYSGYSYVRLVRETTGGHFLVAADATIFEGDREGNVSLTATVQDNAEPHAWEALRIDTGQIVVSTGYAASLQLFDASGNWQQTITGGADDANPFFFADMQVLPTGNFIVTNWQGHDTNLGDSGIQLLEYDRSGNLVWFWRQDSSFVSSLQHLVVLDGLDLSKLHVENLETGVLEPVD